MFISNKERIHLQVEIEHLMLENEMNNNTHTRIYKTMGDLYDSISKCLDHISVLEKRIEKLEE